MSREISGKRRRGADAQLAAHALVHRATIASNDGDFARFPRVRWMNPLRTRR